MSIVFLDGFDHTTTGTHKWTSITGTYASASAARTGSAGLIATGTNTKQVASASEHATLIWGMAFQRVASGSIAEWRFLSDSGATRHITVSLDASGQLSVFRGTTAGTQLGSTTSANTIPVGAWVYVEIKVTLNDSTGVVTIKVNNAQVFTISSADTKNAGTKTVLDTISINGAGSNILVDDLYVCNGAGSANNDFLGDCKIETLFPNGNGNTSQLTGSDGNSTDNYLLVDETAPNTTDYNGSATNDQYDTYAMSNLATGSGTVFGMAIYAYAAKSDAGTAGGAIVVRSGGTDYELTDNALGTGYQYYTEIKETDPATSAAWAISAVNSMEVGFKKKAS